MKKVIATILIFLTSFVFLVPVHSKPIECDCTDLRIRVKEELHEKSRRLHIRVSMTESAKVIGKPKTKVSGKTMQLLLFLHLFSKANKGAGAADFHILIPEGVERVTFGKQNCEIWPRNLSIKKLNSDETKVQNIALEQFNIQHPNTDPFDISVHIRRYGDPLRSTYLRGAAGYEVVVWHPKGRVIYQIVNFQVAKTVSQHRGVDY